MNPAMMNNTSVPQRCISFQFSVRKSDIMAQLAGNVPPSDCLIVDQTGQNPQGKFSVSVTQATNWGDNQVKAEPSESYMGQNDSGFMDQTMETGESATQVQVKAEPGMEEEMVDPSGMAEPTSPVLSTPPAPVAASTPVKAEPGLATAIPDPANPGKFLCSLCQKSFASKQTASKHATTQHKN